VTDFANSGTTSSADAYCAVPRPKATRTRCGSCAFGDWVALGIGSLLTLLDSSLVVIGGGMIETGELLLAPVLDALPRHLMPPEAMSDVRVVAAELGGHAAAIGAALLGGPRGRRSRRAPLAKCPNADLLASKTDDSARPIPSETVAASKGG
jgi:predicted NBD/HSP70 family sugar kinase